MQAVLCQKALNSVVKTFDIQESLFNICGSILKEEHHG